MADVKRLDIKADLKVDYCIPLWLRDEQILLNCKRVKGRIQQYQGTRTEPIAIACFGPSLKKHWEEIKSFKYVMTCSGSHKFLIGNGIIPTWHVEVDPRPHKIDLLGPPHPDVTYLPASACHPKYMDHLMAANSKIQMWHVFSNEEEAIRVLPRGEWAITGGSSVGLRCLTLARFFGFTEMHIWGMDGCMTEEGSHADKHPNSPPGYSIVEYEGKEYRVTPSILECARQTWHELDVLKDVNAVFHGEGLVQEMAKKYERKEIKHAGILGINRPELISAEYVRQNQQLHEDSQIYGVGGGKYANVVLKLAESIKTTSILDYGCGKGYLAKEIPYPIWEYDPAVPGKDRLPRPADIVVCTDVLEHIEPEKLLFVLDDIRRCLKRVGFFVIHTGPANKTLPDGRNTHLIQKDRNWWLYKLRKFFEVPDNAVKEVGPLLHIVAGPKPKQNQTQPPAKELVAV